MSKTSDVILIVYSPWCISLRDTFVKELSHSVNTVAKSAVFTRRIVSTVPVRFLCRGCMCVEARRPGSVSVRSVLPSCFRPGRFFVSHVRFHARKLRRDYVFFSYVPRQAARPGLGGLRVHDCYPTRACWSHDIDNV